MAKDNPAHYCFWCSKYLGHRGFCNDECHAKFYDTFYVDEQRKKKQNWLLHLWNKTVFPDLLKAKKDEKKLRKELEQQARQEALKELKPELIKHYKKEHLDKLSGKKKNNFMEKLVKGFEGVGQNIDKNLGLATSNQPQQNQQQVSLMGGNIASDEKVKMMLGDNSARKLASDEKVKMMLGKNSVGNFVNDDKIRKMLGK